MVIIPPSLLQSLSIPHHFHLLAALFFTLLRSCGRRSKLPGDWLQALIRTKNLGGISLSVLCIRWGAGATNINGGGSRGRLLGKVSSLGAWSPGLPTPYDLGRGLVQLSWSGTSGKPSLTLSLTPKPASTENLVSPSLFLCTSRDLGSDYAQNNQHPVGQEHKGRVVQGRVGRRESCTMRGGGGPSPPARCPCIASPFIPSFKPFPAPLQALTCPIPSQECPCSSPSLESAVPVLLAQGKAPLSVCHQIPRNVI